MRSIQRDYLVSILTGVVNMGTDMPGDLRLSESIIDNSIVIYNDPYNTAMGDTSWDGTLPEDSPRNSSPV